MRFPTAAIVCAICEWIAARPSGARGRRLLLPLLFVPVSALAMAQSMRFDIPAQPLPAALKAFADQAKIQLLYKTDTVLGANGNAVIGTFDAREALQLLLEGTGLEVVYSDGNAATIRPMRAASKPRASIPGTQSIRLAQDTSRSQGEGHTEITTAEGERATPAENAEDDEIVVTGSRIRGAKQASPVVTITQEDMRKHGHTDIGQAIRALPHNFSGGQNPTVAMLGVGNSNQNNSGGSALNLRGLGADATLTLLNGTRLPYDGHMQATDAAAIPVAAIERVEILLDGASAIYGSDAVGGVANIVLRRDYNGGEISARWGGATQGGYDQEHYTGVGGATWDTGGFIVTAEHNRNGAIRASQRDSLSYLPPDTLVYGLSKQDGVLLSAHQEIAGNLELTVDAFYTRRTGHELNDLSPVFGFSLDLHREAITWGIAPSLRFALPGEWSLRLAGALGESQAKTNSDSILPGGVVFFTALNCYCNESESLGLETEGPLFDLPGGKVRGAFGGGYRGNEFASVNRVTGVASPAGDDSSHYAYGEIFLPLVSEAQAIPWVHRLSLSGAVRYENYESLGETTTPKVGAIWGLSPALDVKASWGKSFKVPTLLQQFLPVQLDLGLAVPLGGTSFPPESQVLSIQGGNPDLNAERAETLSVGFVLHPTRVPGLRLEASWFDVDYTDRVAVAFNPITTALSDPAGFPFVTFNPTLAQQNEAFALAGLPVGTFSNQAPIPYDPALIVAILDARYVNTAAQNVEGVDLIASYAFDLFGGHFTTTANATWLEMTQTLTALSSEETKAGIVFNPPKFRGRISGSWTDDRLTVSATVNQTGGVTNNLVPGSPKGDAFTTVDLIINYALERGPLGGELEFTLGAQNLFDKDPPYLQPELPVLMNYDSTNYTAIGRVVSFALTQRY